MSDGAEVGGVALMSCFSRRGGSSSLEAQGKQTRRKRKFEEVLPWPSSLSCRACACVPCRGARCLSIQLDFYKCMEFFSRLPGQKAPRPGTPLPFCLTFSAVQSFQSLARRRRKEADLSTLPSDVRHGLKNEPVRIRDSSTLGRGTLP